MSDALELAKKIFINEEAELRCGWRIAAFAGCLIGTVLLIVELLNVFAALAPSLSLLINEPTDPPGDLSAAMLASLISSRGISLAAALVATSVCARWLERRSFGSVGYKLHPGWLRDFLLGCVVGGLIITFVVAIETIAGAGSFELASRENATSLAQRSILLSGVLAALLFLIAAAFEELLFRGFPFQALVHNIGPLAAISFSSVFFGLAHLQNPDPTALSTINTMLAGVWLGLAYLATRSLWLATGLHFAWNFVMVFVFGLPVSGWSALAPIALLRARGGEPEWLAGGSYGPEGGVAATVGLLFATWLVTKRRLFRPSKEMLAAIRHAGRKSTGLRATPDMSREQSPH